MDKRRDWVGVIVWLGLVIGGASTRLVFADLPNFAPVAALALFAGYFFSRRAVAAIVPVAVLGLSDFMLGGYDLRVMAVVYASLTLPAVLGAWLRPLLRMDSFRSATGGAAGLIGSSLAGSVFFFLSTNLAVWGWFDSYAHTWAGLVHCYVRALPFFRFTLMGDLLFAVLLFGGYAAVRLAVLNRAADASRRVVEA